MEKKKKDEPELVLLPPAKPQEELIRSLNKVRIERVRERIKNMLVAKGLLSKDAVVKIGGIDEDAIKPNEEDIRKALKVSPEGQVQPRQITEESGEEEQKPW